MLGVTVPGFDIPDAAARRSRSMPSTASTWREPEGPLLRPPVRRRAPARAHRPRAVPAGHAHLPRRRDALLPARRADRQPRPRASDARCWPPCAGRPSSAMPCWPCLHDLNLAAALADDMVLLARTQVLAAGSVRRRAARRPAVGRLRLRGAHQPDAAGRPPVRAAPGRFRGVDDAAASRSRTERRQPRMCWQIRLGYRIGFTLEEF